MFTYAAAPSMAETKWDKIISRKMLIQKCLQGDKEQFEEM